ncbi:hypothetical protein Hesp01_16570 [Herbidospora sp. NBRC 101105]|nr:hypothetical protein Hesp01_16570 [Herbidospora sp. NBRC 101105]
MARIDAASENRASDSGANQSVAAHRSSAAEASRGSTENGTTAPGRTSPPSSRTIGVSHAGHRDDNNAGVDVVAHRGHTTRCSSVTVTGNRPGSVSTGRRAAGPVTTRGWKS